MIIYNKARQLAFYTIAKNCSESILQCRNKSFERQQDTFNLPNNTKVICILRDPIDRWISGTVEFFSQIPPSSILGMNKSLVFWLDKEPYAWDFHTEHQSKDINTSWDIDYFWFGPTVLQDIQAKYKCFDKIIHTHREKFRTPYRQAIIEFMQNNPQVESRLKTFYKNDYTLIENSQFVNRDVAACF